MQNDQLKVLLITEAASAGAGRHVMDLAAGLLDRNCQVHVIYSSERIDDNFADGLRSVSGLKSHCIKMRRAPHASDFRVLREVRNYIKREGPFDIAHAHSSKGGAILRMLRKRSGMAVVYTPHCIYTMNPTLGRTGYHMYKTAERLLAHRTDAVVAVSPQEKRHIAQLGIKRAKVHYIANGVAGMAWQDEASARELLNLPTDSTVIGFIGRMSEQKDPLLMLRAFKQVAEEHDEAHLAMVGSGPLESEAHQLADELCLQGRVHWLGYRPPEVVMPAFDVLAMPSRYEGMPYVLIEALAAGLPIVATAVGGTRSTIISDANGHIVDQHCPSAFAAALGKLVQDNELRAQFSATSLELSARFTTDNMVKHTHKLYCKLLNRKVSEDVQTPEPQMVGV